MPLNPKTHALPAYIMLLGFTRLVAVFFVLLGCGISASSIVKDLLTSYSGQPFLERITRVSTWSPLAGLLPVAALLWLNSTRIARWCSPRIDLGRCQVCGYRLGNDRSSPCPECGSRDRAAA